MEPKAPETTTPIGSNNQGNQLGNDIFLSYSQLALLFANLSKLFHEERIKNNLSNDENFALKLQLCNSGIISLDDNAIVSDDQDNAPNKAPFRNLKSQTIVIKRPRRIKAKGFSS